MISFNEFTQFCVSETEFIVDEVWGISDELTYSLKSDGTEVTSFDLNIEDYLRESISKNFPEHGIRGEERDPINEASNLQWILDPIDGTFGFTKGVPLFGTLIGLLENNEPKYGFLRMPLINNSWMCGDGIKALKDGKPLLQQKHSSWENALILTTDQQTIEKSEISRYWKQALKHGATARTWGDCYGYYLLCLGKAEMMVDTGLKPYDILPLIPILQGSGIEVRQIGCTDYQNIVATKFGAWDNLN